MVYGLGSLVAVNVNAVEVEELGATLAHDTHILGHGQFAVEVGAHDALLARAEALHVGPVLTVLGHLNLHVVMAVHVAGSRYDNDTGDVDLTGQFNGHSLQMVIKQMVLQMQAAANAESEMAEYYANLFNQIKYSVIVIASLPLLILYPFLQKYFEKGVMIGSVKG